MVCVFDIVVATACMHMLERAALVRVLLFVFVTVQTATGVLAKGGKGSDVCNIPVGVLHPCAFASMLDADMDTADLNFAFKFSAVMATKAQISFPDLFPAGVTFKFSGLSGKVEFSAEKLPVSPVDVQLFGGHFYYTVEGVCVCVYVCAAFRYVNRR